MFQAERIHNSDFDKRLEELEECISHIDRQTDERHRHVVYLKKGVQEVSSIYNFILEPN